MTSKMEISTAVSSVGVPEKLKKNGLQQFPEAASGNDTWRQGDIYITLLDAKDANSLKKNYTEVVGNPSGHLLQLAEGETMGSRHILRSGENVKMWQPAREKFANEIDGMLAGPIIEIGKGGNVIDHPEHAPVGLPEGTYVITYQRTADHENRIRRVRD